MDETESQTCASAPNLPSVALERWGPFERLHRVGRGSFGEVYRAFDPVLQRTVALKLLLPRERSQHDESHALLREARAMARVRHPNVVPIHGVDRHEGRVGFWSDFVQGKTLAELLAAQGPLGPKEAALIGIDVCRAVSAVHAAGFFHRDIKPANVMREEGGRILLMDFGLTHERGALDDPSGTPAYMAPELLMGEPANVASEIYAIGMLLFHLLTGRYAVEGLGIQGLLTAHASGARRALLDLRPDLPEALAYVIETAINPAPQKRFASMGHMITALSDAIGMGSKGDVAAPVVPKPHRLRPWMLATLAMAAALIVFVLFQIRPLLTPGAVEPAPLAAQEDDYKQAHDLLTHYYRPRALETAIPLLETIAAADPRFAPAFADLGRANFLQFIQQRDTKYIDPARDFTRKALALAPDLASAHVTLGSLYAFTGQNDLASHELDEALRLDKFNAAAYGALADLYTRQGRTELVEPTLQKAVSLAPSEWGLAQQLGEHYLNHGKWAEAGEQYRHAADLTPDNPRAYNNLGLALRGSGKLDESAAAFQKAIDLEPTALRFRNLGMVQAEAGKYGDAAQMLERSIEMQPNQYRSWGLLAAVYQDQHADAARVKEAYLKAIALSADLRKETPRNAYLLSDIGRYYAALGMEKEALPLLAQAAALGPDLPEVLYQAAVGYELLHRREEALHWIAQAQAGGYASGVIARNPQLTALRADPRYGAIASATQ